MKNSKITSLIVPIILISISSIMFYFILKQINQNTTTTKLSYEEWQKEEVRRETIKSLDRAIKKIELEKNSIETHFVSSRDVVPFLDFFEQAAQDVNAKAEVASVGVSNENDSIVVDLQLKGSFESLYKYITLLENAPYVLEINSFILNDENINVSTINDNWNMKINIKLLSYIK